MRVALLSLLLPCGLCAAQDLIETITALELDRRYDEKTLRRASAAAELRTRVAAARVAGRLKDKRAHAWLLPMLSDPSAPVRRATLFALGQIGGSEAFIAMRAAMPRLSVMDLPHALEALGKTRDPRGVTTIVQYLGHASVEVRNEAALGLFRLGDASALTELFVALGKETATEPRWRMVYAASRLLRSARHPDPAWSAVLERSMAGGRRYHERVFATLGRGSLPAPLPPLQKLFDDPDPRVVVAALRGLRRPWTIQAAQAAVPMLAHADFLVREAAVRTIAAGDEQAGELLVAAAKTLEGDSALHQIARVAAAKAGKDVAVRAGGPAELAWRVNSWTPERLPTQLPTTLPAQVAAAEVCAEERVGKAKAFATLTALLAIKDFTVRATAIASLAKRGAGEHAEAIVAAAKDSPGTADLDVRLEAAKALGTLGIYHAWLESAAVDPDRPVRDAARAALTTLKRPAPSAQPGDAFRLGQDTTRGILAAAHQLLGARVRLETNRGTIEMVLLPDEAPAHCVNFATLVRKGFYDKRTWHRVVADFVIQGGCPRGDGWGGPGYMLPDEIGTRPYMRGTVGMPKSGDDTGGCQIFITHLPTPHLDGRYTVYAQVVAGLDVMDRIRVGDTIRRATLIEP